MSARYLAVPLQLGKINIKISLCFQSRLWRYEGRMNRRARRAGAKGAGQAPVKGRIGSVSDLLLARAGQQAVPAPAAAAAFAVDPVAAAYAKLRREEAGKNELDAARNRAEALPGDLGAWLRYAHLLSRAGNKAEALAAYRHCAALDPEREEVAHMVAALGGGPVPARAADSYVANMFDGFAERFDETLVTFLDYRAPEILGQLGARLLGPAKGLMVADLGCGTGLAAPHFRPSAAKLLGVDLSAEMLRRAAARGLYDDLQQAEIGAWLAARPAAFDLAVAADVFCYFGDLDSVFAAAAVALRPGGWLLFTVEAGAAERYALRPSGRYVHAQGYVTQALEQAGFEAVERESVVLRRENDAAVEGFAVGARVPTSGQ